MHRKQAYSKSKSNTDVNNRIGSDKILNASLGSNSGDSGYESLARSTTDRNATFGGQQQSSLTFNSLLDGISKPPQSSKPSSGARRLETCTTNRTLRSDTRNNTRNTTRTKEVHSVDSATDRPRSSRSQSKTTSKLEDSPGKPNSKTTRSLTSNGHSPASKDKTTVESCRQVHSDPGKGKCTEEKRVIKKTTVKYESEKSRTHRRHTMPDEKSAKPNPGKTRSTNESELPPTPSSGKCENSDRTTHSYPGARGHAKRDSKKRSSGPRDEPKQRGPQKTDTQQSAQDLKKSVPSLLYADTYENRRIDRVDKPRGTMVFNRTTKEITTQFYIDSPLNRRLNRVGEPRGSLPSPKKSPLTKKIPEYMKKIRTGGQADQGMPLEDQEAHNIAQCIVNRDDEDSKWAREDRKNKDKSKNLLVKYTGTVISYDKLDVHKKIGQGGFGEIYLAKLDGMVVAVKSMRVTKTGNRRAEYEKLFMSEVVKFCGLNNRNIVKFIGASVEKNLSIVMEYMEMSLYDAIHVKDDVDFDEDIQLKLIREMCAGLKYMHTDKHMAHCDLKSQNVLLDCVGSDKCTAKISDFGLSMDGSQSVRKIGTRRYWAPELHRGETLDTADMMKTDIFSLSLIFYELIYEEEPFYNVQRDQLAKHVDKEKRIPELSENMKVDRKVSAKLRESWKYRPAERPEINELTMCFNAINRIYAAYLG